MESVKCLSWLATVYQKMGDLRFRPNFSTIPLQFFDNSIFDKESPNRKIITTELDFFEKLEPQLPLLWQQ